jgi:protein phosphatase
MQIEAFGHTHIGKSRALNEDNYLCLDLSERGLFPWRPLQLLAVADGIGGHAGGELASSLAIEILQANVLSRLRNGGPPADFQEILKDANDKANAEIFAAASEYEDCKGMGTTLAAAIVAGDRAAVSNVGDSRVYLVRDNALHQLSQDHSWTAEQLRLNVLTEQEIRRSPFKNMITRSLGFDSKIVIDTLEMVLLEDDYLLLCTDGLHGQVDESLILKIIRSGKTTEKICRKLIEKANFHGGRDNITTVVAFLKKDDRRPKTSLSDTVKLER